MRPSFTHQRDHRLCRDNSPLGPYPPVRSWECSQALPTKEIIDYVETILHLVPPPPVRSWECSQALPTIEITNNINRLSVQSSPWYPCHAGKLTHHRDHRLHRDSTVLPPSCGQDLHTIEIIDYIETILPLGSPSHELGMQPSFTHHRAHR
jgi:hypothetical protein